MSERDAILAALPVRNRTVKLMDDQDVRAIMRALVFYHKKHVPQYDQFAAEFDVGSERDIAQALFNFCKENVAYRIEEKEKQTLRSPGRILSEVYGDCKHYASFIAGVLDALKRSGLDIDWAYRFAKYVDLAGNVSNHVFVVLYPHEGREIWIDPVLNWFDYHLPYKSAITQTVNTMPAAAAIGCCGLETMGDAGSDLSAYLKQYELGLYQSYNTLLTQNVVTPGVVDILTGAAASLVPGASIALQAVKGLGSLLGSAFGVGSDFTRITSALLSFNPVKIFKSFQGRTYNTDSYFAASDYSFHVLGKDVGASTNVPDNAVPPALMWFIKKLGIYISGRAHLGALRNSVDDYLALYRVNTNTTQDRVRVQIARDVMLKYMPNVNVLGNWARTVGVYDDAVTAAIERARISDPNALTDTQGTVKTAVPSTPGSLTAASIGIGPILLLIGAGLYMLSSQKNSHGTH